MKRKIIVVIALALLLIGIAYVRALFSHQERRGAISPEVSRSIPADLLDDYYNKDSAARSLDQLRQLYSDSLIRLAALGTAMDDSLPRPPIDSLRELIRELQEKLDSSVEEVREARLNQASQFEKLVAAFYQGEISRLPSDLSRYEREVSIKEIKDKACKYFGLSADSLDNILDGHL